MDHEESIHSNFSLEPINWIMAILNLNS
jgi:hypothetical protein